MEPLGHGAFARLALARCLSMLGSRAASVALILYVTTQVGGPGAVGAVLAAYVVPMVALLLVGGVWADRLPRQRVMAATDLIRCTLHAGVALLCLTGGATLGALLAIGFVFGASEAFSRPAATGLTPQTLPAPMIQRANSVLAFSDNLADFLGPVLATAIFATLGAGYVFALDAATFLVSGLLVASIQTRASARAPRSAIAAEVVEGYRILRARPWTWMMLLTASVVVVAGIAPWMVAGPSWAEDRYGSVSVFGLVSGGVGLGMVAGAVAASGWRPRAPLVTGIAGLSLWPAFMAAFAAGAPVLAVLPLAALAGAAVTLTNVWWETALAERIPRTALSRVAAWDWLVSLGLLPLGYVAAGPMAAALGPQAVILGAAGICLLCVAAALGFPTARSHLASGPGRPPERGSLLRA